jgi:hypothetical protein
MDSVCNGCPMSNDWKVDGWIDGWMEELVDYRCRVDKWMYNVCNGCPMSNDWKVDGWMDWMDGRID